MSWVLVRLFLALILLLLLLLMFLLLLAAMPLLFLFPVTRPNMEEEEEVGVKGDISFIDLSPPPPLPAAPYNGWFEVSLNISVCGFI